ncbi:hypothetical protein [Variovorax guangxiensis]|uniref:hypothetical protein n=1 Tax=Variovorax guangxiensis TaxID=1775474 RepID=UPI002864A920|nr:hypothetical protein [Variovorax guangxiensis]MDR6861325.1 putative MnhB-related membrane protein [Variovorax guangxiensis]
MSLTLARRWKGPQNAYTFGPDIGLDTCREVAMDYGASDGATSGPSDDRFKGYEATRISPSEVIAEARTLNSEIDDLTHADSAKRIVAWLIMLLLVALAAWLGFVIVQEIRYEAVAQPLFSSVAVIVLYALYGSLRVALTLQTAKTMATRFVRRHRELVARADAVWILETDEPKSKSSNFSL